MMEDPDTGLLIPAYREIIAHVPRQCGKGLALDTPLPTPSGWTTMGEVAPGAVLLDDRGEPTVVSFVSQVRVLDCYRVEFSDGTSVVADGDHLWTVFDTYASGGGRREPHGRWRTVDTRELAAKASGRWRLPDAPILAGDPVDLPIDPYLLGAWLGDGSSSAGIVHVGDEDIDWMRASFPGARAVRRHTAWSLTFYGLATSLRELGVFGDKHIPAMYLRAAPEQRLALLQGLMDTDGTVTVAGANRTSRRCEFSVCSERLALGVAELVRSLGIRVVVRKGPAKLRGVEVGVRWRLGFSTDLPVFRLPRKAARLAEAGERRRRSRHISAVAPVAPVPTRCIQVDSPSALFLAGDGMVPTHNTTVTSVWIADRCTTWESGVHTANSRQRVLYSAQTGKDARDKLIEEFAVTWQHSARHSKLLRKVTRGVGYEGVVWANGSRVDIVGSSEKAGHGKVVDLAIVDESFSDVDFRREQAMLPAMATRRDAQLLNVSTAGTDESLYLLAKVAQGRAAVDAGRRSGIAYFEWSAPPDADPDDEGVWWAAHPALASGRVSIDVIRQAHDSMKPGEFQRAFLNQWTSTDERLIPVQCWDAACAPHVTPEVGPRSVLAVDVDRDRVSASLVVADAGGRLELVDHREAGTGWVVDRAVEIAQAHGLQVVVDRGGPANTLAPEMEQRGVKVRRLETAGVVSAAGALFDALVAVPPKVQIRRHPVLDHAAATAAKRPVVDAWVWARKSGQSAPALMAASLAHWCAAVDPQFAEQPVVTVQVL